MVLIRHVLQSLSIHILAAFTPPKAVFTKINSLFANFFRGQGEEGLKCHWIKWSQCCLPVNEGGVGIRKFDDLGSAFALKAWWTMRASQSLWARFMKSKYWHLIYTSYGLFNGSSVWKQLVLVRPVAENNMVWIVGRGDMNFWFDKWLDGLKIDIVMHVSVCYSLC